MPEPVSMTVGALVALAISEGAKAVGSNLLGEATKDLYARLKTKLAAWAGGNVAAV
jgi:hypothetical protein